MIFIQGSLPPSTGGYYPAPQNFNSMPHKHNNKMIFTKKQ